MRYSFISAALALVSSVVAQTAGFDAITSPTQDQNIPAGSSFNIIWQPGSVTGTVTITLLQGATPSTLQPGAVIASSIDNTLGKYTWSVPSSSSFATYGFKIVLDSTASSASPTFQYSYPFHITGGTSSVSGSGSGSATGSPSTTTMQLSTGPNYSTSPVVTSTSTSSIPSSTVTVVSTSSNSTITSATLKPTTSSNVTLSTLKTTSTKTGATSSGGSSTSTSPPTASTNAAVSNLATGGLAVIGGIVLAFAF